MRPIDADNLQKDLNEEIIFDSRDRYRVRDLIDIQSTIEAEPVRHGKWLHGREVSRDYIGDACVAIHYEKWWCSKCNYTVDGRPLWNYCPICGARMEV